MPLAIYMRLPQVPAENLYYGRGTPVHFTELPDLAAARLGGKAVAANDEFFASKDNLLKVEKPVFIEGKYTNRGKWMDGWETRRRRTPGHDWCIVRLGKRGIVRGINVDTSFFIGNFPEYCSIDALDQAAGLGKIKISERSAWTEILLKSALKGGSENLLEINNSAPSTHIRLNIFPDGGIARLRVHGEIVPDWKAVPPGKIIDLAAVENGGMAVASSDMFFGSRNNLLFPGRGKNMGDGWETKRRRGPGYDWVIIRLGRPGLIEKIEIDTAHFKGNYPDAASVEACYAPSASVEDLSVMAQNWSEILPNSKLKADSRHLFTTRMKTNGPATHVRLNIYPDGGVSRFRIYGKLAPN